MRLSAFVSYFFAGAFLTNSLPHVVAAITRRRNMTPFGPNSSPEVNLLWSGINFVIGSLLMLFADKQAGVDKTDATDSKAWQLPYEAGCLFWSLFGVLYAWFTREQR